VDLSQLSSLECHKILVCDIDFLELWSRKGGNVNDTRLIYLTAGK